MERMLFVRAGEKNKLVERFLHEKIVAVGWDKLNDLSNVKSPAILKSMICELYPDKVTSTGRPYHHLAELVCFVLEAKPGDLVATVDGKRRLIYIGKIQGNYQYLVDSTIYSTNETYRHILSVSWKFAVSRQKSGEYCFPQTTLKGKTTYWLTDDTVEAILSAPRMELA